MSQNMYIQSGELVIISRDRIHLKIEYKFFKSLRFFIIALVLLVSIIPCIVAYKGIIKAYETRAVSLRTADIQSQCTILSNQLTSCNYLLDQSSEVATANLTQLANIYNGRVMIINSDLQVVKDTFSIDDGKTIVSENVVKCMKGTSTNFYDKTNKYIEVTSPIMVGDSKKISGVMLASVSTDSIEESLRILNQKGNMILGLILIVVIALSFFIAHIVVKPFQRITAYIDNVSEGYEEGNMHVETFSEAEEMSESINTMLGRLKQLNDSREEFVSNVSHELRTPLTSMKVLADSLVSMGEAPVELYQEFMEDIAKEIDRENDIISDLLSLVRMDRKSPDLNIQPVNINDLLELILKRLKPIAEKKNVEVVLESFRPVTAEIDEVKLTLAFSNLVENAIKYNKQDGFVHVSLNADHKYFYVKVADSGIGIPEEDQASIFERFYRVDKSHSREIGGTGLGLAITRSAIVIHRGSIKVYSNEGEGTTFTVRIPLVYAM